jgi:HEAT repeat protein
MRFYQFGRFMRKYIYISVLASVIMLIAAFNGSTLKDNRIINAIIARVHQPKPAVIPPPLDMLGQGARFPTAAELEQEKSFNAQQVALAGQWLKSPDVHQRIMGAEQLSAYQSPESEQRLADTLQLDAAPEVRTAAAHSLALFKRLSDPAVNALLEALNDADKSTRIAALNTLFTYALSVSAEIKTSDQLLAKLQKEARSGHLNKDVRVSLQAFIKDQEPPTNAFFSTVPSQAFETSK